MINNKLIYYESCNNLSMPMYPLFIDKLLEVQTASNKIRHNSIDKMLCNKCKNSKYYKLGNIVWSSNLCHRIEKHQLYPSEYFIKVIMNCYIINGKIINPPIVLNLSQTKSFAYISVRYNLLLVIDALFKQGSKPRYQNGTKFIYSEHSGVLTMKNNVINNIVISAETTRLDPDDDTIYLPTNTDILTKHEYIFHTHPNTTTYGGRIDDGIVYEFPSANDVVNFVKFYNEGIVQASLVIAPEGMYVIRPIYYQSKYNIVSEVFYHLKKLILKLESKAIKKVNQDKIDITNPDTFHKVVGSDFKYINMYNHFIEPHNLFIEYYPRVKKNNEWTLRQINLALVR